ncbi:hypothetical protein GNF76_00865 [Pseudomonas sp. CCM 7893]|uniref:Uncharacterized protein n=2 Tax=Pseudomonas spelaei TaxID=1055469 RepID=A0A6I3W492_9PSED|nr:hypothetical protein [Pseudomonas spelaei]MUF02864.1 hypothetical protein [Pseudomonas spelaei]
MTAELYDGRITTTTLLNGGLANDSPQKGSTGNANSQPAGTNWSYNGLDSDSVANNWPSLGSPGSAVWWNISTYGLAGNRGTQVATQVYNGQFQGAMYTRAKHDGSWSPWNKIIRAGDYGLGPANNAAVGDGYLYTGNIDNLKSADPLVAGRAGTSFFRLNGSTTGMFSPTGNGFNGAILQVQVWDSNTVVQTLQHIEHTYTRNLNNGSYNDWVRVFTNRNATGGVVGGISSGLMDMQNIGAWRVARFLNGSVTMAINIDVAGPISGNTAGRVDFTLPVATPDWGKTTLTVDLAPTATQDHYGIITKCMESATTGYFLIRNGATTQSFYAVRVTAAGYWK